MAKKNVSMPMSGAGILSTGTENMSKFQLRPSHVVVLILVVAVVVILMNLFA